MGATAALTVGLVAGGVGIAAATTSSPSTSPQGHGAQNAHGHKSHGGPGDFRGAGGTVTAVTPSSLTVSDPSGTLTTYTLDGSTTYRKGHAAGTIADVTVGARVMVIPTAQGSTTAATIVIAVPELRGTVSAVAGSTITITDRDGFWRTISTNGSTTYSKAGATASASDVTVGQIIGAEGAIDANHTTLDASSITIGLPVHGFGAPGAPGAPGGHGGPGDGGPED